MFHTRCRNKQRDHFKGWILFIFIFREQTTAKQKTYKTIWWSDLQRWIHMLLSKCFHYVQISLKKQLWHICKFFYRVRREKHMVGFVTVIGLKGYIFISGNERMRIDSVGKNHNFIKFHGLHMEKDGESNSVCTDINYRGSETLVHNAKFWHNLQVLWIALGVIFTHSNFLGDSLWLNWKI